MTDAITVLTPEEARRAERDTSGDPKVGEWFWIVSPKSHWARTPEELADTEKWLGCVIAVGTNYVKFDGPHHREERIHIDELDKRITFEPDANRYINERVEEGRKDLALLMGQVQEITARLMITMGPKALDGGNNETAALALRSGSEPIDKYKKSLVKAKDKELPALFTEIENTNKYMAAWMSAPLIPLKAEAEAMKPTIKAIESRIFNVELYAGLCEDVLQIADGAPAPMHEKVHLFQRRHYMDEECLADYETGGMTFKSLKSFFAWMVKPEHLNRILPKPRCIVAFQVKRHDEDRRNWSWRQFIEFAFGGVDENKFTYLFIRNGEKVYVLQTGIEFGSNLFPDIDQQKLLTGQIYAKDRGWGGLITEHQYRQMIADENANQQRVDLEYDLEMKEYKEVEVPAYEAEMVDYRAALKKWEQDFPAEAEKKAKQLKSKKSHYFRDWDSSNEPDEPTKPRVPWKGHVSIESNSYEAWNRDSVYYDDVSKEVEKEINRHNRLVVVLQGLFDRSEILHPHRPVQLWTGEGFEQNLVLVYDYARALSDGPKPDFEAFRRRLNTAIHKDSVFCGQDHWWEKKEAERLNKKKKKSEGDNYRERYTYRPGGDPGPGKLAFATNVSKKGATFTWTIKSTKSHKSAPFRKPGESGWWTRREYADITKSLTVPLDQLFNVSAYRPGDFKQFFNDPRTRAEFMRWAPYLPMAEEFHAGSKKFQPEPKTEKEEP